MPDWVIAALNSPLVGGVVSGLIFLGGIKVEIRNINQRVAEVIASNRRAHVRIDDHIDRHHVGVKNA
jgi:hypothetical protein